MNRKYRNRSDGKERRLREGKQNLKKRKRSRLKQKLR